MVIKPQFDNISYFFTGIGCGEKLGTRRGISTRQVRSFIEPQFDEAWSFSEGLARVKIGSKWGYIDRTGEMVIKPQFDYVQSFSKGLAMVQKRGVLAIHRQEWTVYQEYRWQWKEYDGRFASAAIGCN